MNADNSSIDRGTVARWVPGWHVDDIESIALLAHGPLNMSWRLTVNGECYVLKRRTTRATAPGTKLARENRILNQVSPLGLGPSVFHIEPNKGLLVTAYLEGKILDEEAIRNPAVMARICDALRQLHGLKVPAGVADLDDIVEGYLPSLPNSVAGGSWGRKSLNTELRRVLGDWLAGRKRRCICHNDLLHSNIVDCGSIAFIDWEYASVSDPMFDLAVLALHHGFDEKNRLQLLNTYFGDSDARLEQRFAQGLTIAELVFTLWVLACRDRLEAEVFPEKGELPALIEKLVALTSRYRRSEVD